MSLILSSVRENLAKNKHQLFNKSSSSLFRFVLIKFFFYQKPISIYSVSLLFSICENVGHESFQDIFANLNPSHNLELDYFQFFGAELYFPKPVGFPQFHLQMLKAADESIRTIHNKLSLNYN